MGTRFNPQQASQAVSPWLFALQRLGQGRFQSRSGFPGWFAAPFLRIWSSCVLVSIPLGLPRLFRHEEKGDPVMFQNMFQSRTGCLGLLVQPGAR